MHLVLLFILHVQPTITFLISAPEQYWKRQCHKVKMLIVCLYISGYLGNVLPTERLCHIRKIQQFDELYIRPQSIGGNFCTSHPVPVAIHLNIKIFKNI